MSINEQNKPCLKSRSEKAVAIDCPECGKQLSGHLWFNGKSATHCKNCARNRKTNRQRKARAERRETEQRLKRMARW